MPFTVNYLHLLFHKPAGSWTPGRAGRQRCQRKVPQHMLINTHKTCVTSSCDNKLFITYITIFSGKPYESRDRLKEKYQIRYINVSGNICYPVLKAISPSESQASSFSSMYAFSTLNLSDEWTWYPISRVSVYT